jgi:hypothetical protein
MRQQLVGQVRADEPGASRDQDLFHVGGFLCCWPSCYGSSFQVGPIACSATKKIFARVEQENCTIAWSGYERDEAP